MNDTDDNEEDLDEENDGIVGITKEIVDFVNKISSKPELWTDFPISLSYVLQEGLEQAQVAIQSGLPSLNQSKARGISYEKKNNYRCAQSLQQFYTGGPYAVSFDCSFLVCACDDTIKIVDSANASIKSTIDGDSEPVTSLSLSQDNKFIFSASHNRQIRVWDVSSLKCLRSWKGHEGSVMGMSCHASGGLLATAGADRKVLVWVGGGVGWGGVGWRRTLI
ncbi:Transducin family protein/WD-40 repeat family protein [Abeliophyllum distichum]|uniref:Transducin family protein/WD-40 repeat family protein n=1 Tax=Abeliophyllum distichum TaxID=126358 RepID=A0ABD1SFT5_9LAMI